MRAHGQVAVVGLVGGDDVEGGLVQRGHYGPAAAGGAGDWTLVT